jgi:hypothetical protein
MLAKVEYLLLFSFTMLLDLKQYQDTTLHRKTVLQIPKMQLIKFIQQRLKWLLQTSRRYGWILTVACRSQTTGGEGLRIQTTIYLHFFNNANFCD